LSDEVKKIQEEWKQLDEEELTKKCTDWLAIFETDEMKSELRSFGCID
jgi:hypothetical protein